MNSEAKKIAKALNLSPHPEGGYFRETCRSGDVLEGGALPGRYRGSRSMATAILFLITRDSFSAMHRLKSNEILHFYSGSAADVFFLHPSGKAEEKRLGNGIAEGETPQILAPRGVWFGMRTAEGGDYSLIGSTAAPGFDFEDFELAGRAELLRRYPRHQENIRRFYPGAPATTSCSHDRGGLNGCLFRMPRTAPRERI